MIRPLRMLLLALVLVSAGCGHNRSRERSSIPTAPGPASSWRGAHGPNTMYEDPGEGGGSGAIFVDVPLPGEVPIRVPLPSNYDPFTDVAVVALSSTPMYKFTYRYWCLDSTGAGVASSQGLEAMEYAGQINDSTLLHDFGLESFAYSNAPAAYGADSTGSGPKPGDPPPPDLPPISDGQFVDIPPKVRATTWGAIKAMYRR